MVAPAFNAIGLAYGERWEDMEPRFKSATAERYGPLIRAGQLPSARLVLAFEDPAGDDDGNGNYVYPAARDLLPGALDLRGVRVTEALGRVGFEIDMAAVGGSGLSPWGFFGLYCRIVLQRDGDRTRSNDLGIQLNGGVDAADAFDLVIDVTPDGVLVRTAAGQWLDILRLPREGEALVDGNTLGFSLPVELIGSPREDWRCQVMTGFHARSVGIGDGVGQIARVAVDRSGLQGGGGDALGFSSNVYDLLTPPGVDQRQVLQNYSARGGYYVLIPLVP